jgi:AraC-like DNA-binding protein
VSTAARDPRALLVEIFLGGRAPGDCQANDDTRDDPVAQVHDIIAGIPDPVSPPDEPLVRACIGQRLAGLVALAGMSETPAMMHAVLAFLGGSRGRSDWRSDALSIVAACADSLARAQRAAAWNQSDWQVTRALETIAARYRDFCLTPAVVAEELDLSGPYLCRLLRRETGCGFWDHVHHRRIMLACELLAASRLTTGQIADAVGYGEALATFRMQFKRRCGVSPGRFRTSRRPARGMPATDMTTGAA